MTTASVGRVPGKCDEPHVKPSVSEVVAYPVDLNLLEIAKVFGFPMAALVFVLIVIKRGDVVTAKHHLDVIDLLKQRCTMLEDDRNFWRDHARGLDKSLGRVTTVAEKAVSQ